MKVRKRMIFLFLLPASTLYLVFFLFPAVWAFYFSFFDWSGFGESKTFIGLGNYLQLMNDDLFWTSLTNTIKILFLGGFITLAVAFFMTILFSTKIRGKKFFRAMIFMPNVIATIALTTLWAFIYNPKFGLLTNFFAALGFEGLSKILWTAGDKVFYAMLIALIWIQVGFMVVLLLAGADKIPFEFYEAAKIEGANIWQMFIRITIPLVWDVITVAVVFWSIWALKVFEFPYAFFGITPPTGIYTVGIYMYIMGFGKRNPIYRLGYATAIGVVLLLVVIVVIIVLRRVMRKDVYQY
ncbi:MAG: sugar ABC transporter permease [Anaerolineales bacterium]|nr:sugar ABC transporter permease [Anaerolineales bacterium]